MMENFKFLDNKFPYTECSTMFENGNFKIITVDSFDEKNGIREIFYKKDGFIGKKICEHPFSESGFNQNGKPIDQYWYEFNDLGFALVGKKRSILIKEQFEEEIQFLFDTTTGKHIEGNLAECQEKIEMVQSFNRIASPFNQKLGMTREFHL